MADEVHDESDGACRCLYHIKEVIHEDRSGMEVTLTAPQNQQIKIEFLFDVSGYFKGNVELVFVPGVIQQTWLLPDDLITAIQDDYDVEEAIESMDDELEKLLDEEEKE